MPHNMPMTEEDKKWQAQMDANTLAESNVIKEDPDRLAAAGIVAQEMAEEKLQEALAMKRVAARYPSLLESA